LLWVADAAEQKARKRKSEQSKKIIFYLNNFCLTGGNKNGN